MSDSVVTLKGRWLTMNEFVDEYGDSLKSYLINVLVELLDHYYQWTVIFYWRIEELCYPIAQ